MEKNVIAILAFLFSILSVIFTYPALWLCWCLICGEKIVYFGTFWLYPSVYFGVIGLAIILWKNIKN